MSNRKTYTYQCVKCGKSVRTIRHASGRPPTLCPDCRMKIARDYQREYARKKAATRR